MGEKAIIRLGDRTSHDGTVLEGHQLLIIHGKPAAGVGHKVHCPKCPGPTSIVEGAMNASMMGINIAVEGMKTSCGATLIASQFTDTIEYGSGSGSAAAASPASAVAAAALPLATARGQDAAAPAEASDSGAEKFDEQVRVLDADGNPIANLPYHITDEEGNAHQGVTDEDGCCERVRTSSPQTLVVLTGVPALEKWR